MFSYKQDDLKTMLKIRNFELTVLDLFSKGLIKGTTHTCIGQEYIPVSIRPFIKDNDFVISNHRCHGHFLSLFGDVEGLLSEIMDKEGAVCNGIGGSQHIFHKNFISTGVQAEGIAVGTGVAWTYRHTNSENICFVYIGDGTFGRGSVYESLNLACLYKLPMVIIVENNEIAMTTRQKENMAGTIEARISAFGCDYVKIESHDPEEIRTAVKTQIANVRAGKGPLAIEFKTERLAAHSKGDDTRDKEEVKRLREKYWYDCCEKENPDLLSKCETEVKNEMNEILVRVMQKEPGVWSDYDKRNRS